MKKIIPVLALLILGAGAALMLGGSDDAAIDPVVSSTPSAITTPQTSTAMNDADELPATNTPASSCAEGGSCTAAEVAMHNEQADCWVVYKDKVYNVTDYVDRHEGGAGAFDSTSCGADIEPFLTGQRGTEAAGSNNHSSRDIQEINDYFFADLAQ